MPPSTAAVNALMPATKPSWEIDGAEDRARNIKPATEASAAPITKVSEMVRSTFTPHSAAILASCSQARCARPSAVREMMSENTAISTTVTAMMRICM